MRGDDLHDAVVEALRHGPSIRDPLGYIARVAFRLRNKRRQRETRDRQLWRQLTVAPPIRESQAATNQFETLISDRIKLLPAHERRVIEMRYLKGMSVPAIAGELRKSPHSVRSTLFRARSHLRNRRNNAVVNDSNV